ncbi:hypothetical protein StoSoilB5_21830 [Arthrobacter sp. StoSoilB5]|nr:hypothetical protein StoSoilB5_21830 [Arthrobacter sp. StoSoilB5]
MKHPRAAVIVDGARTPIGKLNGALRSLPASSLAAKAIEAALKSARVRPEDVQYTIMGQALGAGAGQNPARTAALEAGIPLNVPALTVNKVCLSGSSAVLLAQALIITGVHDVIVAGAWNP